MWALFSLRPAYIHSWCRFLQKRRPLCLVSLNKSSGCAEPEGPVNLLPRTRFRVSGFRFRIFGRGLRFQVSGFGFPDFRRVPFGFRVSGFGFPDFWPRARVPGSAEHMYQEFPGAKAGPVTRHNGESRSSCNTSNTEIYPTSIYREQVHFVFMSSEVGNGGTRCATGSEAHSLYE